MLRPFLMKGNGGASHEKSKGSVFADALSDLRKGREKATRILEEVTKVAQHPDIEEAVKAQAFIVLKAIEDDRSVLFLLAEEPMAVRGRLLGGAARNPEQRGATSFLADEIPAF